MTVKNGPISGRRSVQSFVDAKRPKDEEVRKQLDFGYSWDGQMSLLF